MSTGYNKVEGSMFYFGGTGLFMILVVVESHQAGLYSGVDHLDVWAEPSVDHLGALVEFFLVEFHKRF